MGEELIKILREFSGVCLNAPKDRRLTVALNVVIARKPKGCSIVEVGVFSEWANAGLQYLSANLQTQQGN